MGLDEKLISIIVPVYNVEQYVRRCLDSILGQTYRNLEILVIDDGSADDSGSICDEYAEKDDRIRVFHTKNQGLSAARNLGLDHATGKWIGFVDSDDWIEPDMYEVLLKKAKETGADVIECGFYLEYSTKTVKSSQKNIEVSGREALRELVSGSISHTVWNKIWKSESLNSIRFPIGRVFEDIATTYLVLFNVDRFCSIATCKYHYLQREGALSKTHSLRHLIDYWLAYKEQYLFLRNVMYNEDIPKMLYSCSRAVVRTWAYYCGCSKEEKNMHINSIREMYIFTRNQIPLFGYSSWGLEMRIGTFFTHFYNDLSFFAVWLISGVFRRRNKSTLVREL